MGMFVLFYFILLICVKGEPCIKTECNLYCNSSYISNFSCESSQDLDIRNLFLNNNLIKNINIGDIKKCFYNLQYVDLSNNGINLNILCHEDVMAIWTCRLSLCAPGLCCCRNQFSSPVPCRAHYTTTQIIATSQSTVKTTSAYYSTTQIRTTPRSTTRPYYSSTRFTTSTTQPTPPPSTISTLTHSVPVTTFSSTTSVNFLLVILSALLFLLFIGATVSAMVIFCLKRRPLFPPLPMPPPVPLPVFAPEPEPRNQKQTHLLMIGVTNTTIPVPD